MAKVGIDGFFLNCQLDEKFELIEAEFGLKGFAILIKLLQRIYGEHGYYCEYNGDISLLLAAKWNVASKSGDAVSPYRHLPGAECSSLGGCKNLIDHVVTASIRRGIFDETMYEKYGILTSAGIQRRYKIATRKRVDVVLKNEYLLLSDVKNSKTDGRNNKTDGRNNKTDVCFKQSKVKESKVNNISIVHSGEMHGCDSLEDFFESIWKLYPIKKGKGQVSKTKKKFLQKIGFEQIQRCVGRFIEDMENQHRDRRYWMHGSTFFNSGYVDYLDENYGCHGEITQEQEEEPLYEGDDW